MAAAPVDEQTVIDDILAKCDHMHTGRIRVSNVVRYLRSAAKIDDEYLEALSVLLDPKGIDADVESDEFRTKTSAWIRDIQQQQQANRSSDNSFNYYSENKPPFESYYTGDFSVESLEGYGGETSLDSPKSCENFELLSTINELKRVNQKLNKDKEQLYDQLGFAEDRLIHVTEELKSERHRLQKTEMDLEEAKTRIWELIETKRQDVDAMTILSRKRGLLEERNQKLETSLAEMQEQIKRLECLDEERRSLAGQLHQASKSLGSSGSSIEIEQSFESADEWVRIMNQLKSENQLLAKDKSDIEEHSKERQQTVRDVSSPLLVPVFSSSPLQPSMDDSDDDDDDDEFLCPVSSLTSSFEQFALIASQAEVLSRQRAEKAMQLISELSVLDPSRRSETEAVKMEFEEEREFFRQKVERLIESKKRTMKRKQQLETTVQKLKQEKEKLVKQLRAKELQLSADINDPVTNGRTFSNWESLINEDSFGVETEKGLLAEKMPLIKEESCSTESLLCTLLCILAVVVFSATFAFTQF